MSAFRFLRFNNRYLLALALGIASLPVSTFCQQTPNPKIDIPPELMATDPEIRSLLQSVQSDYDAGNYGVALPRAKEALALAERKGLIGDKALAEKIVATGYFSSGVLEDSLKLYRASLQDAIDV